MTEQIPAPWAAPEPAAPSRRKVSWGESAGADMPAPAPRAGTPAPATFGPGWAPQTTDTDPTDTARLHAGALAADGWGTAAEQSPTGTARPPAHDQPDGSVPADGVAPENGPPAPPAAEETADPAEGTDAELDFASLFDDGFGGDVEPGAEPSVLEAPEAPSAGVPAAPEAGAAVGEPAPAVARPVTAPVAAPEPRQPAPEALPDPAPAIAPRMAAVAPPTPVAEPVPVAPGAGLMSAHRAAAEAAREVGAADLPGHAAGFDRNDEAERLYPIVDRILGLLGGGDPQLHSLTKRMELTRDRRRDAEQRHEFEARITPALVPNHIQIGSLLDVPAVFDMAYDELIGIGPLGPLWRDDTVQEILVSGPDKVIVERGGALQWTNTRFRDLAHLERIARNLAGKFDDRTISRNHPLVTVQLPGARVQFVWKPLAVNKVVIAIRKFPELMGVEQLLTFGSLSPRMAEFLRDVVASRATVLISGGTSSGKTTVINAVSAFIPDTERVVTIEDALELKLANTHVESLVTKEAASADDHNLIGTDQLLKASLRLRPDRIIVGEIRDPEGCAVMLEAANTGHDGTMTTVHANSAEEAVKRMTTLLRRRDSMPDEVARDEVCTAIDVVVQVVKRRGKRYISEIAMITRTADGWSVQPVFAGHLDPATGAVRFEQVRGVGADTDIAQRMLDAGIDPTSWEVPE